MNDNKQRIDFIDVAKGIGMFLIVWGHVSYLTTSIETIFNTFKITLFYVVSGILISVNLDNKKYLESNQKEIMKHRFHRLMKPYYFYSFITLVISIVPYAVNKHMVLFYDDIYATVTCRGISTLWFLPTLYLGYYLFDKLKLLNKIAQYVLIIFIPILCCLFIVCRGYFEKCTSVLLFKIVDYPLMVFVKSIIACWFIYLGFCIQKLLYKISLFGYIIVGGVTVVLSSLCLRVDLNTLNLGKFPLLFFVCGFLGAVFIIGICINIEKRKISLSFFRFLGQNSLFIMATHAPLYICKIVSIVLSRLWTVNDIGMSYYFWVLVCELLVLLVEFLLIKIISLIKHRCTKIMNLLNIK